MKLRFVALAFPLIFGCSALCAASPAVQGGISFQQALDAVSKAGYKNIHKIEREHNYYEVEAFDAQGKEIKFKIDPMTGAMTPMTEGKHCKKHHAKHHASTKVATKPAA